MTKPLEDYATVAERIAQFYERFPEGSLQTRGDPELFHVGEKTYLALSAVAYRKPDDPRPGVGWAWEPVPGPTPFTHDSELQNAETAAWGRAIVALGFETRKGIASREEVQSRRQEPKRLLPEQRSEIDKVLLQLAEEFPPPDDAENWHDHARRVVLRIWGIGDLPGLSPQQAEELLDLMRLRLKKLREEAAQQDDYVPDLDYEREVDRSDFEPPGGVPERLPEEAP